MKKYFLFFFNLAILSQFTACNISEDDTSGLVRDQYFFNEKYTLSNVKKTYQPDDFIFLEYATDKMMTDLTTGQSLRVGNARMFPSLSIIGPLDGSLDGLDRFDLTVVEGEVVEGKDDFIDEGYLKFNIGCPDNLDYALKLNLGFPEPGGYVMFLEYGEPSAFHPFPFTSDDDCSLVNAGFISDDADIGTVQFFLDVDDTNRDEFDSYVTELEGQGVVVEKKEDFQLALDEKRAFFVRVVE